jgi:hypothetical protein
VNRSQLASLCLISIGFVGLAGMGCSALTEPMIDDVRSETVAMAKAPVVEAKVANVAAPPGMPNAPNAPPSPPVAQGAPRAPGQGG